VGRKVAYTNKVNWVPGSEATCCARGEGKFIALYVWDRVCVMTLSFDFYFWHDEKDLVSFVMAAS